jgi:shikimate kinase
MTESGHKENDGENALEVATDVRSQSSIDNEGDTVENNAENSEDFEDSDDSDDSDESDDQNDASGNINDNQAQKPEQRPVNPGRMDPPNNIILVGAMGSGKSSVGWLLSRMIGYGFIDLDACIEQREKKSVERIFADSGEAHFRQLEKSLLKELLKIKSHVIAVGGGTVMDDENWEGLKKLGAVVWLNAPPDEIARRFAADLDQLKKRPLLAELALLTDFEERHKLLTERLSALIGQRQERYREARLEVNDRFSTPESTAGLVKTMLVREGILNLPKEQRPYDRWNIL